MKNVMKEVSIDPRLVAEDSYRIHVRIISRRSCSTNGPRGSFDQRAIWLFNILKQKRKYIYMASLREEANL